MHTEETNGSVSSLDSSNRFDGNVTPYIEQIRQNLRWGDISRKVTRATSILGFACMFALLMMTVAGVLDSTVALVIMAVVLLASTFIPMVIPKPKPISFTPIERTLVHDCDPYQFARAYYDLMEAFERDQDRIACLVNIALGLFLQGSYDQMRQYLDSVNMGRIPMAVVGSYYDLQAHYYLVTGNMQGLYEVEARVNAFLKSHPVSFINETCEQTLTLIQAYRAAHSRSYQDAYRLLEKRNQSIVKVSGGVSAFQQVEYRYLRACVDRLSGDTPSLIENCHYVVSNGNLLVYVQLADAMLAQV